MALGVVDEGVRRVEAHGLGVEQGAGELRREVAAQPRRLVGEHGKGGGVALREAELGKGDDLLEDGLRDVFADAAGERAFAEELIEALHVLARALATHGAA